MKINFPELLQQNKVVIPIIQRDYAQGRTDSKTNRIRSGFLDAIFNVLTERTVDNTQAILELDFIYGYRVEGEPNRFYPIDGQQRLTTLWLLYWYVSRREKVDTASASFLSDFKYETRHSTNLFCEELVAFVPGFETSGINLEIADQPWFFESWNFDPSVQGMLVMLAEIEKRYNSLNLNSIWQAIVDPINPLMMYMLDMDKVGLADDLYIKMNSRGKGLTDFEYFKVGFLEIIQDDALRIRFEQSIDGSWAEYVWDLVNNSSKAPRTNDLSLQVDTCFLRLINYLSATLASIHDLPFNDINESIHTTQAIYCHRERFEFLFDSLDALTKQHTSSQNFWNEIFYFEPEDYLIEKTRLFFNNDLANLAESCMLNYSRHGRGFSLQEQLLLYATLLHLIHNVTDFNRKIRVVRNLVANSEDRLRNTTIGTAFNEIHQFVANDDINALNYFKTDQIQEEKDKQVFILEDSTVLNTLCLLEDSNFFRGCISIFSLDKYFNSFGQKFLELFPDNLSGTELIERANLLLCWGDYTQDDGENTNVLSGRQANWRSFLTTPGYNKTHIFNKTKPVLKDCLEWFILKPESQISQIIDNTLSLYIEDPKDWRYYVLKYQQFREDCNQGYFRWRKENDDFDFFKMKERQRNGQHWDPFLVEIKNQVKSSQIDLDDYGGALEIFVNKDNLGIWSENDGYYVVDNNDEENENETYNRLIKEGILSEDGMFFIKQNSQRLDLEDRIERGVYLVSKILN